MKLIVGLGNIGQEYINTYHNVGFECVDYITSQASFVYKKKFLGEVYRHTDNLYLKPHTYMNHSGESVLAIKNYYHIEDQNIMIIHDDSDITLGEYKIHQGRGSGGHNGINSILTHISKDITRIRIGIRGDQYIGWKAKDFVLRSISLEDRNKLQAVYQTVADEIRNYKTI